MNTFILHGVKLSRQNLLLYSWTRIPTNARTVNWTALHIPMKSQEVLVLVFPARPWSTPSPQPCQAVVGLWADASQHPQPGPVVSVGAAGWGHQLRHSGCVPSVYFQVSTSDISSTIKLRFHCLAFCQHSFILLE